MPTIRHPESPIRPLSDVSGTNIKRRDIAEAIVAQMNGEVALLRMTHVKPELVPLYISAASFLLLTSDEEGSPNIIRECLVMNKPVFSVNVGDAANSWKDWPIRLSSVEIQSWLHKNK